jgi:hypothetical protein
MTLFFGRQTQKPTRKLTAFIRSAIERERNKVSGFSSGRGRVGLPCVLHAFTFAYAKLFCLEHRSHGRSYSEPTVCLFVYLIICKKIIMFCNV